MRVELRPTLASDFAAVSERSLPIRIRAITAVAPGPAGGCDQVLGLGGIGYRPDGVIIGFAFLTEEFRRYPCAIHRAGRAMMQVIRDAGVPEILAMTDASVPSAARWLERLGFRPSDQDGVTVYLWRRI